MESIVTGTTIGYCAVKNPVIAALGKYGVVAFTTNENVVLLIALENVGISTT